ncbi:hypothetical protein BU16DRAFT_537995 [Lophium mytilinum]|uniref:Uncharacterized protein n=1 Tax=Lophium mytilinum TaxID=390894 RepID=A0A6A6QXJ5_9PEZI|nr:hypothetical protein BU16DRAFT_537995 [Lophium mytilinum]
MVTNMEPHSEPHMKMERSQSSSPPRSPLPDSRGDSSSAEGNRTSGALHTSPQGSGSRIQHFPSSGAQAPMPSSPWNTHPHPRVASGATSPLNPTFPGAQASQASFSLDSRQSFVHPGPFSSQRPPFQYSPSQHSPSSLNRSFSSATQHPTAQGQPSTIQAPGPLFSHYSSLYGSAPVSTQSIFPDGRHAHSPHPHTPSRAPVRRVDFFKPGAAATRSRDEIQTFAQADAHIVGDLWWKPALPDPSIPTTEAAVMAIATQFEAAIWDISSVLVPRNGRVEAFTPGPKALYTAADVWAMALLLVNQLGLLYEKGCFVLVYERATQLKDECLTFGERVVSMCRVLKANKSMCESLMANKSQVMRDLVHAPDTFFKRIVGNVESNKLKGETLKAGQGVLGTGKVRRRSKTGVWTVEERGTVDSRVHEESGNERSPSVESHNAALALASLRVGGAREQGTAGAERPPWALVYASPYATYATTPSPRPEAMVPLKRTISDGEKRQAPEGKERHGQL